MCKYAKWNDENKKMCRITNLRCIHNLMYTDYKYCYEEHKIYPRYNYIEDIINTIDGQYDMFRGFGTANIEGKLISKNENGYIIDNEDKIV